MIAWLIGSGLALRRLVVALVVAVLGFGLVQLRNAPVDAYPEFEATQVQVQAEALGLSAHEVEQLITVPIEQDLLNGVPWLETITSRSMPGLSAIDLVFEPGTDLYQARQMVQERMSQAKALPNVGTPPAVIQPTSSTSRIAMVGLKSSSVSLIEMSVLARWQLRPRLMSIPGVSQVSIWGQQDRQLQVQVDPERLRTSHVTLTQLIETTGNALWVSPLSFVEASTPGTGGFVETPNQRLGVQHVSPITSSKELADVAVKDVTGPPVRLGDVASVVEDHQPLIGDATDEGEQSLMLVVERFPGVDTARVTHDVEEALAAMAPGLRGITVDTSVYRPAHYLDTGERRVGIAALIGGVLLALVIGLVTASWRVAVIAMTSVALSATAALWVEYLRSGTLTTMTLLGLAAAMALVIDDAVGDTTTLRARLRQRRDAGQSAVAAVVTETVTARRGPLGYATIVTVLALGPLFLLGGPAGALVRPAALTFALAVAASLLVALVVTPVLSVMLLSQRGADSSSSREAPAGRRGRIRLPGWFPAVRPGTAGLAVALLALLGASGILLRQSGDTLPEAQDRSVVVRLQAAPGTALPEMNRITTAAAVELRGLEGVREVGTHVGRAIASDRVADVDRSEIWLTIADDADYAGTLSEIRTTIHGYPGLRSGVTTYSGAMLADAGVTTGDQLVVRVYGTDLATLRTVAEDVRQEVQTVSGVLSPDVEAQVTEPTIEIQVDLAAAQRVGLRPGDVRRDASTLISGLTVGSLYEQQAIFDVVLWGGPVTRESVTGLEAMLIDTPSGKPVPLGSVAEVRLAAAPTVITHDAVSRSIDVTADIRGRSAADVAADVNSQLRRMNFPYEYHAEVVGDAVDRAQDLRWIWISGLVAALLGYLLLQAATGSWRGAAVLLVAAPFAAAGGLLAAQLTGGVLTGGVLAALFVAAALALRQALSLVRRAQDVREPSTSAGDALTTAVREAAPAVLGTALATAALLLPTAIMGNGPGLEVLQPFAVTLMAGLATSVVVVLLVVPGLYPVLAGLSPVPASPDIPDRPDAGRHTQLEEQR
jgi:Cu/Ag efflux pump CusA